MDYDISQPVPQGSNGTQDAENSRIAAIANELERLCAVHEAQLGNSQADVSRSFSYIKPQLSVYLCLLSGIYLILFAQEAAL